MRALLLSCLILAGCRPAGRSGYTVLSSELSKLRTAQRDAPFTLETEVGKVRVAPETRLRFQTESGWSTWVPAKTLHTDDRGLSVVRSTELSAIESIRVEQPTAELLYALQALCKTAAQCDTQVRVFVNGDAPLIQGRLDHSCLTPTLRGWVTMRTAGTGWVPGVEIPKSCGFIPRLPPEGAAHCEVGPYCEGRAWVARSEEEETLPIQAIAAIELWETGPLVDGIVKLGQVLHSGRWFFLPGARFNAASFEQHGSVQVATYAGRRLMGSLGEYLHWTLSEVPEDASNRERAVIRIDRPTSVIFRAIRDGCDSAGRLRTKYERERREWIEPCHALTRVFSGQDELLTAGRLSDLGISYDETALTWNEHQTPFAELSALELVYPSAALGLIFEQLSYYVDRLRWARWSVDVLDPTAVVPFAAVAGELTSTDTPPRYLVERAFLPWEALQSVQIEPPGALDALFGRH
ncbi:MAG: hypothetical protein ACT4TC_16195 [Myxococcaceae bacterium]